MSQTIIGKPQDDFYAVVDDEKLRLTLTAYANALDERTRQIVYRAYNDDRLHSEYRAIRASRQFEKGSQSKVRRKILEFPGPEVYQFVDKTMTALYGPEWINDRRALTHELVRPWWVVEKL